MTASVAMHLSDGVLDATTSLLFGGVALAWLALAATRGRIDVDDRTAPLAGLLAAFVFAMQLLNLPVLPGVSGHLYGGALAAILLGPWVGALCLAVVVVIQSLLFADGGLTALGANVTNMALLGTAFGFAVALAARRWARRSRIGLLGVAFAAGLVSTVAAAAGFVVQYAIGGHADVPLGGLAGAVIGVHAVIGIGEGVITALAVGAIARVRPDLIYLVRQAPQPVRAAS